MPRYQREAGYVFVRQPASQRCQGFGKHDDNLGVFREATPALMRTAFDPCTAHLTEGLYGLHYDISEQAMKDRVKFRAGRKAYIKEARSVRAHA